MIDQALIADLSAAFMDGTINAESYAGALAAMGVTARLKPEPSPIYEAQDEDEDEGIYEDGIAGNFYGLANALGFQPSLTEKLLAALLAIHAVAIEVRKVKSND